MCGLIFSMTEDTYAVNVDDFLYDAFLASQVRGMHSTGVFQVDLQRRLTTFKRAVSASNFVDVHQTQNILRDACRMPLTVGHVRHATVGARTDVNAHPFVINRTNNTRLVGVHNGTLKGWKDKEGGTDHEVDSNWAFERLAEEGPLDAFKFFNGAYAMIWHDTAEPDFVYMTRNSERPLHYFVSEDKKTILGASELGMLGWLVDKHGFAKAKDKRQQFFYLPDDKVFKFSIKNIGEMYTYPRPDYDPATTIQKPAPAAVPAGPAPRSNLPAVPMGPQQGPYNRHHRGWDEYDDDAPFGVGRTNYYGTQNNKTQVVVLQRLKLALREARYAKMEKPPTTESVKQDLDAIADANRADDAIVGYDQLENRLDDAIKSSLRDIQKRKAEELDPWEFVQRQHLLLASEVDAKAATHAERTLAIKERRLGLVIAFSGILYDDDTGECLGDAYIKVGQGKVETIDCLVRGLSKKAAEQLYIEQHNPTLMVVAGMQEGIVPGELMYVLTPVTPEQKRWLGSKITPRTEVTVH